MRSSTLAALRQKNSANPGPWRVYRASWFGGARLFGAPRVVPHNFLNLSILMFAVSIASNARAMVHREDGKAAAPDREA
jgi:hypothetical protein